MSYEQSFDPGADMTDRHTAIADVLTRASYAAASGAQELLSGCLATLEAHHATAPAKVEHAVITWLDRLVRAAWDGGWQPVDLIQYAQRKAGEIQLRLLRDAIAAEHRGYSTSAIDARWSGQLSDIGADVRWRDDTGRLAAWSASCGLSVRAVLNALAHLAGFMSTLPRLPVLIPPPGDPRVVSGRSTNGESGATPDVGRRLSADGKVLGRVRALLAKAESTDFPDEAEALSAKAQEMMTKYSLDRALVDAESGPVSHHGSMLAAERIWVDAPYVSAKTYLVAIVGGANGCKCVTYDSLGFVTVVGEEFDVQLVDVLSTSLLVQAGRAMFATRSGARSRTRSFRRAFLISYANRIGERLAEANEHTKRAVSDTDHVTLLPVLARREAAINERFADLFPAVRTRRTTVSNPAGWAAGRAAADQATLNARESVRSN